MDYDYSLIHFLCQRNKIMFDIIEFIEYKNTMDNTKKEMKPGVFLFRRKIFIFHQTSYI